MLEVTIQPTLNKSKLFVLRQLFRQCFVGHFQSRVIPKAGRLSGKCYTERSTGRGGWIDSHRHQWRNHSIFPTFCQDLAGRGASTPASEHPSFMPPVERTSFSGFPGAREGFVQTPVIHAFALTIFLPGLARMIKSGYNETELVLFILERKQTGGLHSARCTAGAAETRCSSAREIHGF